jgi:hypothetical protein
MFYNDFESAKTLGAKCGVHKIGAIYYVLGNLPPKFNSAVMNIHLVSFQYQDLKKCGFDAILEPLVNDVKKLESDGVNLPYLPNNWTQFGDACSPWFQSPSVVIAFAGSV